MAKRRTSRVSRKVNRRSRSVRRSAKRRSRKALKSKSLSSKSHTSVVVRPKKSKKGKKGPSPYNKFVKKMSPVLRNKNPGMKQPKIMKLIAKEWNKQK